MTKHYFAAPVLAAGGIAWLASSRFGSMIAFDKPNEGKSVDELVTDLKSHQKAAVDAVKEIAEKALADASKGLDLSNSVKEKADDAIVKMNGLTEQLTALEQKMARGAGGGDDRVKSLGEQFVDSDSFKSLQTSGGQRGRANLEVKATITLATTNAAGSAGSGVQNTRLPGMVDIPQRRMTIRDLITPGQMDGNTLEYVREKVFTNNAGMVAEGAAKPSSDLQLEVVSTGAKVIAHYMKASRQVIDDVAQLRSMIDQRLLYGLANKEESQLLNGDGTGQNLLGIIPQATAYSAPITISGATSIDMMRLAMLQAALADLPATGHVMNPADWAWIELLKDTTGGYIIGNPQGTISPTLWGLPVVTTQAIAIDKFLTGAFRMGAQLFDRWQARVELATENEDDFIKNLVTILAEERLALAVYRPQAFIYGDFGRVA